LNFFVCLGEGGRIIWYRIVSVSYQIASVWYWNLKMWYHLALSPGRFFTNITAGKK